jgi:hypothetical protein
MLPKKFAAFPSATEHPVFLLGAFISGATLFPCAYQSVSANCFLARFFERYTAEREQCWTSFRDHGGVWEGNIDESHVEALLVMPRGEDDANGWQTWHPRFDVLPNARNGHHDLRVVVDGSLHSFMSENACGCFMASKLTWPKLETWLTPQRFSLQILCRTDPAYCRTSLTSISR